MRKIAGILIFCLIGIYQPELTAQEEITDGTRTFEENEKEYFFEKFLTARQHLKALKTGYLFVRLNTDSKRINFLKEKGKDKLAASLQEKVDKENQEIIAAMKVYYDFSKVYFYYESDSEKILKEKDYNSLFDINKAPIQENILDIENNIYLLFYGSVPHLKWSSRKRFVVYSWNGNQVQPVDRLHYPANAYFNGDNITRYIKVMNRSFHRKT